MSAPFLNLETANFNPDGWFIAQLDTDGVYLRTPDNQMLSMNQDARFEVNAARAVWMANNLNDVLRVTRMVKV